MIELRQHQKEAVKFFATSIMAGKTGVIFDMDPGLGKTFTAHTCIKMLMKKGANVLYVTRKTLDVQARDEAVKLGLKPYMINPKLTSPQIVEALSNIPYRSSKLVVIKNGFLSQESVCKDQKGLKAMAQRFDLIIIDEVHDCKNPNSGRSKSLMFLSRFIPYRITMTGTLIGNNEIDVFVPEFIANPAVFGDSFYRFRSTYFIKSSFEIKVGDKKKTITKYKLRKSLEHDFHERLDALKFSRRLKECVDLPPLIRQPVFIESSHDEAKMMKQLQTELCCFLDSGETISASSLMERTIRLRQLCSAVMSTETGEVFLKNHSKVHWLLDMLDDILPSSEKFIPESAPKIIIWTAFRTTCIGIREMLEQKFLNPVATIIGGQDDRDRDGNIKMFQTDPNCHILVATMASGGVGLNLQQASYMIYFAKSYSQIEDKQSEARAYRIGSEQHSTIFRYDAIIKRSIEEDIERALNDKKTIVEAMEEWRQTYGRDAKRDLTEYIG